MSDRSCSSRSYRSSPCDRSSRRCHRVRASPPLHRPGRHRRRMGHRDLRPAPDRPHDQRIIEVPTNRIANAGAEVRGVDDAPRPKPAPKWLQPAAPTVGKPTDRHFHCVDTWTHCCHLVGRVLRPYVRNLLPPSRPCIGDPGPTASACRPSQDRVCSNAAIGQDDASSTEVDLEPGCSRIAGGRHRRRCPME